MLGADVYDYPNNDKANWLYPAAYASPTYDFDNFIAGGCLLCVVHLPAAATGLPAPARLPVCPPAI